MIDKRIQLGRIDCPTCGLAAGMRITHDKNGAPFGYCDAGCNQQLRIGGSAYRVTQFLKRYPWAGASTVTDTETEPPKPPIKDLIPAKPGLKAEPVPKPKPKGTGNAFLDLIQGVN